MCERTSDCHRLTL